MIIFIVNLLKNLKIYKIVSIVTFFPFSFIFFNSSSIFFSVSISTNIFSFLKFISNETFYTNNNFSNKRDDYLLFYNYRFIRFPYHFHKIIIFFRFQTKGLLLNSKIYYHVNNIPHYLKSTQKIPDFHLKAPMLNQVYKLRPHLDILIHML